MKLRSSERKRVQTEMNPESDVQQHLANDADINTIMAKYRRTGVLPIVHCQPRYGDFSSGLSFHELLMKADRCRDEFDALPADIKKRFRQDPAELIDFLDDEKNRDEAIKMGLIVPEVETPPGKAEPPEPKKEGKAE